MIFAMNNVKFSDNELNLMSYQELRRLSILLRLPANIKKKYMISMIQAHQKGDGCTKTAIANKIMEERKVKKMNMKGRQSKPYIMVSTTTTQQIPTDLSVSTKHEFETRYSYIAHYTKDSTSSGISRIIKEEAEVSRSNRNVLQQPRKPSRKLSTMGRTEIMLPRNHSLTTPVRLMPQYERGFVPPPQYASMSGLSNSKGPYQDANSYNYHFHGEYANALMPSTSHELYRNEPFWHTREMYNNSLMPILSSLLTPNTGSINSSTFTTQYTSQNTVKVQPSFQGIYEKYLKSGNFGEGQSYQTNTANQAVIENAHSHFSSDSNNNYSDGHGNYLVGKNHVDFAVDPPLDDIDYQYNKRDDTINRQANSSQTYLTDLYLPRSGEANNNSHPGQHVLSHKEFPPCGEEFFGTETGLAESDNAFQKSIVPIHSNNKMMNSEGNYHHLTPNTLQASECLRECERVCTNEATTVWEESEESSRHEEDNSKVEKYNFSVVSTNETGGSLGLEISECSNDCSSEACLSVEKSSSQLNENQHYAHQSFPKCRYSFGHNKYPEVPSKQNEAPAILPSFWSAFCTYGAYNKAYSLCRNSYTGTTEAHLNPIMTTAYASPYSPHASSQLTTNSEVTPQITRPWHYSYPEAQSSFSMENTSYPTWNEYSKDVRDKFVGHNGGHDVQVVKCRKHGCHYLYSVSNSCN